MPWHGGRVEAYRSSYTVFLHNPDYVELLYLAQQESPFCFSANSIVSKNFKFKIIFSKPFHF